MKRIWMIAAICAVLPDLAAAQSSDIVTIIPDKGMFVHPKGQGASGMFIQNGKLIVPGGQTRQDIGDFCNWCKCCSQTNKSQLVDMLNQSGRGDIASDTRAISGAVDIDPKKIPRQ